MPTQEIWLCAVRLALGHPAELAHWSRQQRSSVAVISHAVNIVTVCDIVKIFIQLYLTLSNRAFVSAVAVWEIVIERRLGRLSYEGSPARAIGENGFVPLAITASQAELAEKLPPIHQGPFDRIMVAQCLKRWLVMVTTDEQIKKYGLPVLSVR